MKIKILVLMLCFLPINNCFSENKTLIVGEKLVFEVSWQFVKVGYGLLEVKGIEDYEGKKAYHIYSEAKSVPFFDVFYKVRDMNEAWIDVNSFHSLAFLQKIKEGRYKRERMTKYDQKKHIGTNNKGETFNIFDNALDVLSAFYWVRLQKLEPGKALKVNVNSHKKNYIMYINIYGRETINVNNKEYKTIVVEPILQDQGIFMQKGTIKIWLTDDEKHIPVKMKSGVSVGNIIAEWNENMANIPEK
ncbi:MAG: hypothetical protein A2539_06595 [Elusimicrobia bacterium RIFOXYD2_FULL_34_15]|nr:MAG: hypothetical protein A2539_06595 [Elusimicrobia bacterium RIFOXYD2_FULL_34_15]